MDELRVNRIEWPYPIKYQNELELNCDILVLGGGIAGCYAAIAAAKRRIDQVHDE